MDTFYNTPQFSIIAKIWLTQIKSYIIIDSKHQLEAETHLINLLINQLKLTNNYYLKQINQLQINNSNLLQDKMYMTDLINEACESINDNVMHYLMYVKFTFGNDGWKLNNKTCIDGNNDYTYSNSHFIMIALYDTIKQLMTKIYK